MMSRARRIVTLEQMAFDLVVTVGLGSTLTMITLLRRCAHPGLVALALLMGLQFVITSSSVSMVVGEGRTDEGGTTWNPKGRNKVTFW